MGTSRLNPGADSTAAELFDALWTNMADVLGTAATATLVRRSVRRAASRNQPALEGIAIGRTEFDYHYSLPDSWQGQANDQALLGLRLLIQELRPLLTEMTGLVVIRRIERIPSLRRLGMTAGEET